MLFDFEGNSSARLIVVVVTSDYYQALILSVNANFLNFLNFLGMVEERKFDNVDNFLSLLLCRLLFYI